MKCFVFKLMMRTFLWERTNDYIILSMIFIPSLSFPSLALFSRHLKTTVAASLCFSNDRVSILWRKASSFALVHEYSVTND